MKHDRRVEAAGGLSNESKAMAEALLATCTQAVGLNLTFSLETGEPEHDVKTAFLCFEGETLIGFGALPGDPHLEASLVVHPEHRRRGVGREILEAIRAELRRRDLTNCLVVTDQAVKSGRAFLEALGVPYQSSEFRMELDRSKIERGRPRIEALHLRPASIDDAETLVALQMAAFGNPEDEARDRVARGLRERMRRFYIGELAGEAIGMLRAGDWDGNGDITTFGVLPQHRGRGYGRQLLLDAVDLLIAAGYARIRLEVATDNAGALGLYESCGFRIIAEYGFYRLNAEG